MKQLARFAIAALLLALPLTACNSDDLPPASQYTSLQGQILDGVSNKPIADAIVTVDTVLTATTDANGKFTIDKVPSGVLDYTVQAKGYKVVTSSITADPGKPLQLNVPLDRETSS